MECPDKCPDNREILGCSGCKYQSIDRFIYTGTCICGGALFGYQCSSCFKTFTKKEN